MPKGKGTYGSQVGRPPKKQKEYQVGGEVGMNYDPFSSKNPEGVAVEQASEVVEEKNEQAQLQKFMKERVEERTPESNAQERSKTFQMGGEILDYEEGGKVDVTDIVKEIDKTKQQHKLTKIWTAASDRAEHLKDKKLKKMKKEILK